MGPPQPGWTTPARVTRVIDGDTLEVAITRTIRLRLLDCWAPESRTRDLQEKARGLEAKRYLEELIERSGNVVLVFIPTGEGQEDPTALALRHAQTLERFLADVWTSDGRKVSEVMRSAGLATATKDELQAMLGNA